MAESFIVEGVVKIGDRLLLAPGFDSSVQPAVGDQIEVACANGDSYVFVIVDVEQESLSIHHLISISAEKRDSMIGARVSLRRTV